MPRPVTYIPRPSTGSSPWSPAPQGTFPAPRGNPAATASLVLIALALGGAATFWWLDAAYPRRRRAGAARGGGRRDRGDGAGGVENPIGDDQDAIAA